MTEKKNIMNNFGKAVYTQEYTVKETDKETMEQTRQLVENKETN